MLPTELITEDMLLTITLLRKGYVTRYLCERLAFGLAPESVEAFFVQRQRWARGAMQILYLAAADRLVADLTLMQRLAVPADRIGFRWSLMLVMAIIAPYRVPLDGGIAGGSTSARQTVLVLFQLPMMLAARRWHLGLSRRASIFHSPRRCKGTFQEFQNLADGPS